MIIPPAAIVVTAFIVVAKLVFSGPSDKASNVDASLHSDSTATDNVVFLTNCRYQSDFVPHRNLVSTSTEIEDRKSSDSDRPSTLPSKIDDPNEQIRSDDEATEQSNLKTETLEDTDT